MESTLPGPQPVSGVHCSQSIGEFVDRMVATIDTFGLALMPVGFDEKITRWLLYEDGQALETLPARRLLQFGVCMALVQTWATKDDQVFSRLTEALLSTTDIKSDSKGPATLPGPAIATTPFDGDSEVCAALLAMVSRTADGLREIIDTVGAGAAVSVGVSLEGGRALLRSDRPHHAGRRALLWAVAAAMRDLIKVEVVMEPADGRVRFPNTVWVQVARMANVARRFHATFDPSHFCARFAPSKTKSEVEVDLRAAARAVVCAAITRSCAAGYLTSAQGTDLETSAARDPETLGRLEQCLSASRLISLDPMIGLSGFAALAMEYAVGMDGPTETGTRDVHTDD